ncbi:MAG: hypothetical protein KDB61_16740, partial [Planctomycetes bacterium]|nr:hypothetical protein [Planctomycetota bacterium]
MAQTPATIFVDDSSPATSPTGSNWANAFQDLQDALELANSNDIILVAEGSYTPDPNRTDNIVGIDTPSGITITSRHHSFV